LHTVFLNRSDPERSAVCDGSSRGCPELWSPPGALLAWVNSGTPPSEKPAGILSGHPEAPPIGVREHGLLKWISPSNRLRLSSMADDRSRRRWFARRLGQTPANQRSAIRGRPRA